MGYIVGMETNNPENLVPGRVLYLKPEWCDSDYDRTLAWTILENRGVAAAQSNPKTT